MAFNPVTFVALLLCLSATWAHPKNERSSIEQKSKNIISILSKNKRGDVKLPIVISRWESSCNATRAIVWGQTTKNIPLGGVPYAEVFVIDLTQAKVLGSFSTTRDPFEARFDTSGRLALVDDYVIDVIRGKVLATDTTEAIRFTPESCETFPGKSLN